MKTKTLILSLLTALVVMLGSLAQASVLSKHVDCAEMLVNREVRVLWPDKHPLTSEVRLVAAEALLEDHLSSTDGTSKISPTDRKLLRAVLEGTATDAELANARSYKLIEELRSRSLERGILGRFGREQAIAEAEWHSDSRIPVQLPKRNWVGRIYDLIFGPKLTFETTTEFVRKLVLLASDRQRALAIRKAVNSGELTSLSLPETLAMLGAFEQDGKPLQKAKAALVARTHTGVEHYGFLQQAELLKSGNTQKLFLIPTLHISKAEFMEAIAKQPKTVVSALSDVSVARSFSFNFQLTKEEWISLREQAPELMKISLMPQTAITREDFLDLLAKDFTLAKDLLQNHQTVKISGVKLEDLPNLLSHFKSTPEKLEAFEALKKHERITTDKYGFGELLDSVHSLPLSIARDIYKNVSIHDAEWLFLNKGQKETFKKILLINHELGLFKFNLDQVDSDQVIAVATGESVVDPVLLVNLLKLDFEKTKSATLTRDVLRKLEYERPEDSAIKAVEAFKVQVEKIELALHKAKPKKRHARKKRSYVPSAASTPHYTKYWTSESTHDSAGWTLDQMSLPTWNIYHFSHHTETTHVVDHTPTHAYEHDVVSVPESDWVTDLVNDVTADWGISNTSHPEPSSAYSETSSSYSETSSDYSSDTSSYSSSDSSSYDSGSSSSSYDSGGSYDSGSSSSFE